MLWIEAIRLAISKQLKASDQLECEVIWNNFVMNVLQAFTLVQFTQYAGFFHYKLNIFLFPKM